MFHLVSHLQIDLQSFLGVKMKTVAAGHLYLFEKLLQVWEIDANEVWHLGISVILIIVVSLCCQRLLDVFGVVDYF